MIKRLIDNIAKDKKDHILLGMIIGYPLMILGSLFDVAFSVDFMFVTGGIAAIILVGLKELIHDWRQGNGTPEFMDFAYSAAPILFPLIMHIT